MIKLTIGEDGNDEEILSRVIKAMCLYQTVDGGVLFDTIINVCSVLSSDATTVRYKYT
jgi:hypothetical protein